MGSDEIERIRKAYMPVLGGFSPLWIPQFNALCDAALKGREPGEALALLKEWSENSEITNYDSQLCWGCGNPKNGQCLVDCLLDRTRKFI